MPTDPVTPRRRSGFSLVLSLVVMSVLLTVITVASFVRVEHRSPAEAAGTK